MTQAPPLPTRALHALAVLAVAVGATAQEPRDPNRISDEYIPLQRETFPIRPQPLIELGNPFLEPGELSEPFRLPTGAIWSPTLLVWGNVRSGLSLQRRANNKDRTVWANRLDLFAEVRFSPTERVVVGLRPLDENGVFTGYDFEAEDNLDGTNVDLRTLFFEGDLGELFPGFDPEDKHALDWGFGVGRQPVNFQDGILINDVMDSVTVTRNSLRFLGMSNFLATALFAWNEVNRGNAVEDKNAVLFGLMTASDFEWSYIQIDGAVTLSSDDTRGDGGYIGIGGTQRIGDMNSTFRVNGSYAFDDNTAAVQSGVLTTAQLSWVPHNSDDNTYLSAFWAVDEFTSAARDPTTGGPLGGMGILFAATGLGSVGAALSSRANEVVGGAIGYQDIFDHGSQQIIYEIGGRATTKKDRPDNTIAGGVRYQTAWGRHTVLLFDTFGGYDDADHGFYGGRVEFLWKL
ncbi:MAG TPA: hypothetical protein VFZ65_18050 [Planctomycetota bacterium]|nr:hypothetical protein [Planctomycetota bacterium]